MVKLKFKNKNYLFFLAILTTIASCLFILETFVPKPLPFIKLGLSNIIITALIFSNFYKEAFFVSVSKSIVGGFFTGVIISPTIILSLSGAICSCAFMIYFYKFLKKISIIGLSIIGSFSHLMAQLLVVRFLIIENNSIFSIYPLISFFSVITGFITGLCTYYFIKYIDLRSYYVKINF